MCLNNGIPPLSRYEALVRQARCCAATDLGAHSAQGADSSQLSPFLVPRQTVFQLELMVKAMNDVDRLSLANPPFSKSLLWGEKSLSVRQLASAKPGRWQPNLLWKTLS